MAELVTCSRCMHKWAARKKTEICTCPKCRREFWNPNFAKVHSVLPDKSPVIHSRRKTYHDNGTFVIYDDMGLDDLDPFEPIPDSVVLPEPDPEKPDPVRSDRFYLIEV
jgi:hypothetical protein